MNLPEDKKQDDLRLRAAAERQIDNAPRDEPLARPAEELLHELQVHQIELEMQNEALRQAQIALEESRDRYVDLFEFAPVGYLTLTPEGMIEEVNLTGATLLGRERNKLLRRGFSSLAVADDQPRWIRHFLSVKQGDGKGNVELALERGDGTVFDAQLDCVRVEGAAVKEGGTAPGVRITLIDITERRHTEEAMRQSEERHQAILQTTMDGFWLVDMQGRLLEVNETYCLMSGYSAQELLSMRIPDVEAFESAGDTAARIQKIMTQGEDRFESRHRRKDGDIFEVEVSVQYRPAEGGRFVVFLQDITERKRAEAERARLEAQLRESQKMEALGTLAGGVAHDFNNALAAIIGNVELARQDVGPEHPALESLEEIGKASRRAKNLVQQILAFGRRQTTQRKVISLAPIVQEAAKFLRSTIPAGVSLDVACAPDAPSVLADAAQIEQVLINLGGNAWHAIEDQERAGLIEIRLEEEVRGGLRFAVLTVRDNGQGMDEATRTRIFEPFFTTKPVDKGTGLGLSVVYGIAQAHEAGIEVRSTPGEGTAFVIRFAAAQPPAALVAANIGDAGEINAGEPLALLSEGKRVLYVDDEESIVSLMTRLLGRRGYRVTGYTEPRKALEAVRANPGQFDLAVTDYNMPGMSGLEVARMLREIRADLPVILISGYINDELQREAPTAGVRELIFKADAVEDVCEAVARCANAKSEKDKPS